MKMKKKILSLFAMSLILLTAAGLSSCGGSGNGEFVPFSEMSEEEREAFLMAEGFEIIDKKDEEGDIARSLPTNEAEESEHSEESEIPEKSAEGGSEDEGTDEGASLPAENEEADAAKSGESAPDGEAEKDKDANTAEGLSGILKESENGRDASGESSEKAEKSETAEKTENKSEEEKQPVKIAEPSKQEQQEQKEPEKKPEPSSSGSSGNYVYNKNSKKFHYPSCDSVKDMKESNKGFSNDRASLIASGYVPCKRCHP